MKQWIAVFVVVVLVAAGIGFFLQPKAPEQTVPLEKLSFANGFEEIKAVWSEQGIEITDFGSAFPSIVLLEKTKLEKAKSDLSALNFEANDDFLALGLLVDFYSAMVDYAISNHLVQDKTAVFTPEIIDKPCENIALFDAADNSFFSFSSASRAVAEKLNSFVSKYPDFAVQAGLENVNQNVFNLDKQAEENFALTKELKGLCA